MFRYKILLGVFTAFALLTFFAKTIFAQTISVDSATRTVENSTIKIRWDLANAERIREFYYKPFSPSWNLSGAQDNEFFGNAASFLPTQYLQDVSLVGSSNSNSTWQHSVNGQTARIEIHSGNQNGIPVDTVYEFTAGSPSFKVTRTFGFNYWNLPPSRLVPYLVRAYHRDDFTRYAWEKTDGTVGISDEVCEYSCSPGGWKQTWIDLEAPSLNVGIGIVNLSGNPSSDLWLDKDSNSNTAVISASIPNNGYSQSLTVSYLIVPHLGAYGSLNVPFLDLPWNYEGRSFREAALAINSYFDHKYPLLSFYDEETSQCSPAPIEIPLQVLKFDGVETREDYHCHDGYDYGKRLANLQLGDLVLAAGDGCAIYKWSNLGGNTIRIDHHNGYQTRYLHLQEGNSLVTRETDPANCVEVKRGDPIGRVGFSGNVKPRGEAGSHLHFMVIQSKDGDSDFDEDYPWGLTDPFNWTGEGEDPWETFAWKGNTGNSSKYLWIGNIVGFSGTFTRSELNEIRTERYTYVFPENIFDQDVRVEERGGPVARVTDTLVSIGSISIVTVRDFLGNIISNLLRPFTLTIDFGGFDLSRFNLSSLSIYSSEDGQNWNREETTIDFDNKLANAQINHLSRFALFAERLDTLSPTTDVVLEGEEGEEGWFKSDVLMILSATDNDGGLGVDYTLYRVNDEDWQQYLSPVTFSQEGSYKVEFYSADKDENIEDVKIVEFSIDKTVPEARIYYERTLKKIVVEGIDENETLVSEEAGGRSIVVEDTAGNKITLLNRIIRMNQLQMLTISSIKYSNGLQSTLGVNKLLVYDSLKQYPEIFRFLLQSWFEKGEERIQIIYRPKTNKSNILIKEPGQPFQKELRDGVVILYVLTNNGNLEYKY